jgi:hypothetical protein
MAKNALGPERGHHAVRARLQDVRCYQRLDGVEPVVGRVSF